jgi:dihydrofolate reductase
VAASLADVEGESPKTFLTDLATRPTSFRRSTEVVPTVGGRWEGTDMAKTQYYTATSIDGFIADEDNSLDWLFEVASTDPDEKEDRFAGFFAEVGAMAMGSTTYEWVLDHERLLDDPERWRDFYGDTPCWVFTHRELTPILGADLRFVCDDVSSVHAEMMAAAGDKNVWLVGGGDLVGQFHNRGLLDEVFLSVAPVVLGGGAPLLPRRIPSRSLQLRSVERNSRFVFLSYAVEPAAL